MTISVRFALILFLVASVLNAGFGQQKAELILAGCVDPFGVKVKSGDVWYGLIASDRGYDLTSTTITVVDSECQGEPIYLRVDKPGEVIFLVRGINSLSAGSIRTAFYGNTEIMPEAQLKLSLNDEYELMSIDDDASDTNRVHRVSIKCGSTYQTIAEIHNMDPENYPFLVWAGDLDRDGKLDLFFYLSDGTRFGGDYVLFIFSQADEGDLVKRVASFCVQGD